MANAKASSDVANAKASSDDCTVVLGRGGVDIARVLIAYRG